MYFCKVLNVKRELRFSALLLIIWPAICSDPAYLGETLLAVVLEVFGVDVDVVLVHAVWLGELGGVLDKLLHLHSGRVSTEVFEGLHRHVG